MNTCTHIRKPGLFPHGTGTMNSPIKHSARKIWATFLHSICLSQVAGSPRCIECPAGKFSMSFGASICTECDPGDFAGKTGQSICQMCTPGTYSVATSSGVNALHIYTHAYMYAFRDTSHKGRSMAYIHTRM
jgi:hypothetical protein